MTIYDLMKSSVRSLKYNKIRTFLTMLGIIIGISSVITMSAIGKGGQKAITGELQSSGYGNLKIVVNIKSDNYVPEHDLKGDKQIDLIKKSGFVEYIGPSVELRGIINPPENPSNEEGAFILALNKDTEKIDNASILFGRKFLDTEQNGNDLFATIDDETAKDFYGSVESSIGKFLEISTEEKPDKKQRYKIVGVFKNPFLGIAAVFSLPFTPRQIRVPIKSYMRTLDIKSYQLLLAKAKDPKKLDETIFNVQKLLDSEYKPKVYEVSAAEAGGSSFDKILNTLNIFITFVSAISLLVGGIGVMNIMLVSVTERIREIGIRKAIGARPKSILLQFLIESVIISLLGGIIGLATGILISYLVFLVIGIAPVFSITSVLFSIIVSTLIGIIFGVAPARRASKLNPVDALRT